MLSRQSLPAAERLLYSKVRQILGQPGLILGSLVVMRRKCGKESCGCSRNPRRRHRSLYLATNVEGQRRMIYIPQEWEDRIREWVDRYAAIRETLEQLSLACIRRLKSREE